MVYLKIFRAARASLLRISFKKNHEESMICLKILRAARASLLRISQESHEESILYYDILKIFRAARARYIIHLHKESVGAILKKMAISLRENALRFIIFNYFQFLKSFLIF